MLGLSSRSDDFNSQPLTREQELALLSFVSRTVSFCCRLPVLVLRSSLAVVPQIMDIASMECMHSVEFWVSSEPNLVLLLVLMRAEGLLSSRLSFHSVGIQRVLPPSAYLLLRQSNLQTQSCLPDITIPSDDLLGQRRSILGLLRALRSNSRGRGRCPPFGSRRWRGSLVWRQRR